MTVPIREGEAWPVDEGAPNGPHFDITVESASEPGKAYRIVRQQDIPGVTAGYIVHSPACTAWKYGRRPCRHVTRAVALAEEPERTFLEDAIARFKAIGGALASGDDLYVFWAETYRDASDARERRWAHLRGGSARSEWNALTPADQTAQAVAEFDRGPRGAAR